MYNLPHVLKHSGLAGGESYCWIGGREGFRNKNITFQKHKERDKFTCAEECFNEVFLYPP